MKIAFFIHARELGGAAISESVIIEYLVNHGFIQPDECILIQDKLPSHIDSERYDLFRNLKNRIRYYEMELPFSNVFRGAPTNFSFILYCWMKNLISLVRFVHSGRDVLKKENVTVVHLNSIVLWPLLLFIQSDVKGIIHIREVPKFSLWTNFATVIINKYATKIISIDSVSNRPFHNNPKAIVIPNPVDMTEARSRRPGRSLLKQRMGIEKGAFIVSIIGRIEEGKGFEFFINLVKKIEKNPKIFFFVIGSPFGMFGDSCLKKISHYENVKYLGEIDNMAEYYAMTDIVLRCEPYLPLGRTIWEGIYGGSLAMVPVGKGDDTSMIQDLIGRYIFTYTASDVESCSATLYDIMQKFPDTVEDNGFPYTENVSASAGLFLKTVAN